MRGRISLCYLPFCMLRGIFHVEMAYKPFIANSDGSNWFPCAFSRLHFVALTKAL